MVRKTRGPRFDPQLRCLNFSLLRPDVSAFFLSTGVLEMVYLMNLPRQDKPLYVINAVLSPHILFF